MDMYLAIFLILLSLPLTVFLMVWLRGGIRSRSDVIGGFKISLKVVGALTGVLKRYTNKIEKSLESASYLTSSLHQ